MKKAGRSQLFSNTRLFLSALAQNCREEGPKEVILELVGGVQGLGEILLVL